MKRIESARLAALVLLWAGWVGVTVSSAAGAEMTFRAPSVPLVACDPYFSIWSPADKLTDTNTVHWTGKPHRLTSLVRIDGGTYRILGDEPADLPTLAQVSLTVLPTRTIYVFEGGTVRLTLTFMTPILPDDLMVYSRPVTYVTWEAQSLDAGSHQVWVYFDACREIAVNVPTQAVGFGRPKMRGMTTLAVGSREQPVLGRKGDNVRIDWGHLYVAAPAREKGSTATWDGPAARKLFGSMAKLMPMDVNTSGSLDENTNAVIAMMFDLGNVGVKPVSRWLILAYDDEFSIQYFKTNLRPYWRRNGAGADELLKLSANEYEKLVKRCTAFDEALMADLRAAGGEEYARLCALAYRQCAAACKIVADANGQPLLFPKENFSNGCIGTVDVIYPMAPQFLLFNPSMAKAMLVPILDYAASPRWKFPFAPHDLGTYPLANGQVYGGGERTERNQMPVEETGNMLILLAALAQEEGNADFCSKYWPILEKWADYLQQKGFDPENQLCTDDFAGHLAHNVNLSAKAICGLGAFGKLCEMRSEKDRAAQFATLAHEFAERWIKEADDGDHTRLAFDKSGTWSQKYNLVWDRILGLNLFPGSALRKEMDYYKTQQREFGLPLDNRKEYTKLDWTLWTATLTQQRADFDPIVALVWKFLNETSDRVPMTDWYQTQNAKKSGFQARSVVGGVFLQMLYDKNGWKKWARQDVTKAANWAPLPATAISSSAAAEN